MDELVALVSHLEDHDQQEEPPHVPPTSKVNNLHQRVKVESD
jgi:hypothetical protein